jgi:hypothetical protein
MPPPAVLFLFKNFWAAFILMTFVNGAIWWRRSREYRERDPSLTEGYRSLIRGYVTWGNIPWVVMGSGILFGGVPSMFHYFNPRYPNPFVAAFFGSIFVLWAAGTYWLFARGGAEQLINHPGLAQPSINSPLIIKVLWLLCLAGGVAGVTAMFIVQPQPPPFLE